MITYEHFQTLGPAFAQIEPSRVLARPELELALHLTFSILEVQKPGNPLGFATFRALGFSESCCDCEMYVRGSWVILWTHGCCSVANTGPTVLDNVRK